MTAAVILISGRGSNMQALVEAGLPLDVKAVISNRPDAEGLAYAAGRGIATRVVDHKLFPNRDAYDSALAAEIDRFNPDIVLLAGFLRVLGPAFVEQFARRMLNIHPSLLPAFPGLDTHARALQAGVKIHGCTVHFVTAELDHGPIVIQAAVPVLAGDSAESLAARVLAEEHRIYPQALRWFCEGRLEFTGAGIVQVKTSAPPGAALIAPKD